MKEKALLDDALRVELSSRVFSWASYVQLLEKAMNKQEMSRVDNNRRVVYCPAYSLEVLMPASLQKKGGDDRKRSMVGSWVVY